MVYSAPTAGLQTGRRQSGFCTRTYCQLYSTAQDSRSATHGNLMRRLCRRPAVFPLSLSFHSRKRKIWRVFKKYYLYNFSLSSEMRKSVFTNFGQNPHECDENTDGYHCIRMS